MRSDGRANDQLRPVKITRRFTQSAPGSVLIEQGQTRVLCTACVEEGVPPFLLESGQGWLTAEYGMLPGATPTRKPRERSAGKVDGRAYEIQRLVGRALRAVIDLTPIGPRTLWLDCDVLQADGGTRTAAITGAYVALVDALHWMKAQKMIEAVPLLTSVAAVSVGIVEGEVLLDLCYAEDAKAEVDMNLVMTAEGQFVELQGTAERGTFDESRLQEMIALGKKGITELLEIQKKALL